MLVLGGLKYKTEAQRLVTPIRFAPARTCYHVGMANQLTIRGVSDELDQHLKILGREKGKSINAVVIEILEAALGVDERRRRLDRYATWTQEDLKEFEKHLEQQRVIDEEIWR